MDKPSEPAMIAAMHSLYALGALDDEGILTRIGIYNNKMKSKVRTDRKRRARVLILLRT